VHGERRGILIELALGIMVSRTLNKPMHALIILLYAGFMNDMAIITKAVRNDRR
jgi:F0F1-type ATP synthase assembly protein I